MMTVSQTYTLDELAERAGRALDALGVRVGSGRVRERPDRRTVRYYTQLGLVDRPLPVGGRSARYGPRHLTQLVAVKLLQARGAGLAQVQRRLAGASDGELLAALGPQAADVLATVRDGTGDGEMFWRARPAAVRATPRSARAKPEADAKTVLVIPLAAGISLAIDRAGEDMPMPDLDAVREAAVPLLRVLGTSEPTAGTPDDVPDRTTTDGSRR